MEVRTDDCWDVIVVGGGLAGLSAGIYLGRARRHALIVDSGKSLAQWEPEVQNYLGFPEGISGEELLRLGASQVQKYGVGIAGDTIDGATREDSYFQLQGRERKYKCRRLLIATGLFHLPPEIPGARECIGKSVFFCKDCDAFRVQGCRVAIVGCNDEAVEYALAMLAYSPCVVVATNGSRIRWSEQHTEWLREYEIPVYPDPITNAEHDAGRIQSITLSDGTRVRLDCLFTTRGDVYHNQLAEQLGAETNPQGEIVVDHCLATTVPGVYAAGCVTPANCQMTIAAGQGAAAAQAINRDLFEESLRTHSLQRLRVRQLDTQQTEPELII